MYSRQTQATTFAKRKLWAYNRFFQHPQISDDANICATRILFNICKVQCVEITVQLQNGEAFAGTVFRVEITLVHYFLTCTGVAGERVVYLAASASDLPSLCSEFVGKLIMFPFTRRASDIRHDKRRRRRVTRRRRWSHLPVYDFDVPGGLIEYSVSVNRRRTTIGV